MTIRDRAFWLYLLCIIVVGIAIWLTIFTTLYHPGLELRPKFRPKIGTTTNCQYYIFRPKFWALTISFAHAFGKRPFRWLNGIVGKLVPFDGHFTSYFCGDLP